MCVGSWCSAVYLYAYNGFNVSVVEEALRICLFGFFFLNLLFHGKGNLVSTEFIQRLGRMLFSYIPAADSPPRRFRGTSQPPGHLDTTTVRENGRQAHAKN